MKHRFSILGLLWFTSAAGIAPSPCSLITKTSEPFVELPTFKLKVIEYRGFPLSYDTSRPWYVQLLGIVLNAVLVMLPAYFLYRFCPQKLKRQTADRNARSS